MGSGEVESEIAPTLLLMGVERRGLGHDIYF